MGISTSNAPLLAGVCSRLAGLLQFNVWALRAVFVVLLLAKTLLAVIAYGVLALVLRALDRHRPREHVAGVETSADSQQLTPYNERIRDLDRRFRKWEEKLGK